MDQDLRQSVIRDEYGKVSKQYLRVRMSDKVFSETKASPQSYTPSTLSISYIFWTTVDKTLKMF